MQPSRLSVLQALRGDAKQKCISLPVHDWFGFAIGSHDSRSSAKSQRNRFSSRRRMFGCCGACNRGIPTPWNNATIQYPFPGPVTSRELVMTTGFKMALNECALSACPLPGTGRFDEGNQPAHFRPDPALRPGRTLSIRPSSRAVYRHGCGFRFHIELLERYRVWVSMMGDLHPEGWLAGSDSCPCRAGRGVWMVRQRRRLIRAAGKQRRLGVEGGLGRGERGGKAEANERGKYLFHGLGFAGLSRNDWMEMPPNSGPAKR